jgi:hypothetical protein
LIIKTKYCTECGRGFKPFGIQSVCSTPCAIKKAKASEAKKKEAAKKKAASEWKVERARRVDKMKTRTQKINDVRPVFQKWIRHRDKNLPCISCDTQTATKWDAGHYLKAELYTGLIFTEVNCHKQCQRCNQYGGGMQAEYRIGLVKRIGEAAVLELESIKDALRVYKWSDDELSEIKKKYTAKLKE